MRVRYTPRAFADREAIFEYLNQRSPQAARNVKAFIAEKVASLSYAPRRARFVKELGVHALGWGAIPISSATVCPVTSFRSSTFGTAHGGLGPAVAIESSAAPRWLIVP
jgi:plasmid stabilization system protein ParE